MNRQVTLLSLCKWLVLGIGIFIITPFVYAQQGSTIIGLWELTYDPDGSPKDYLEFVDDSEVVGISPDGERYSGVYTIKGNDVMVSLPLPNGKILRLKFVVNDKHQLTLFSEKSGHVAIYEKSKL